MYTHFGLAHIKMFPIISLLLLLLVQKKSCVDMGQISELIKKHPNWSFELESVDSIVKKGMEGIRRVDPSITEDMLREKIKSQLGPDTTHIVRKTGDPMWPKAIPQSYDIREKFKDCADLIGDIEDEGPCHTDSPNVVASVVSDRYCIYNNGTSKDKLSAEYLLGCAEFCTKGASSYKSWQYVQNIGIPTGGEWHSKSGCVPLTQAPCQHSSADYLAKSKTRTKNPVSTADKIKRCDQYMAYDHECPSKCTNSKYSRSLQDDLVKLTAYYHTSTHEYAIRSEIYNNGPVATSIILYSDFLDYESGIYYRKPNTTLLAWDKYFKLIGWGTEDGVKYWLAVNTWTNWGMNKVFKFPRGSNYLYVEWMLSTGTFDPL